MLIVTTVIAVSPQGATLQIHTAEAPNEKYEVLLTPLGEVKPLKKEQMVPGAWYPVPERAVPIGTSWKATSRPMHFTSDVPLTFRFRRVLDFPSGPRAFIEWESQSLTVPAVMGGRYEFQARGSYQLDLRQGLLVTATTTVRRRDIWLEYTNESVSQLELQDVTEDLVSAS
jgi:hypothetical protein